MEAAVELGDGVKLTAEPDTTTQHSSAAEQPYDATTQSISLTSSSSPAPALASIGTNSSPPPPPPLLPDSAERTRSPPRAARPPLVSRTEVKHSIQLPSLDLLGFTSFPTPQVRSAGSLPTPPEERPAISADARHLSDGALPTSTFWGQVPICASPSRQVQSLASGEQIQSLGLDGSDDRDQDPTPTCHASSGGNQGSGSSLPKTDCTLSDNSLEEAVHLALRTKEVVPLRNVVAVVCQSQPCPYRPEHPDWPSNSVHETVIDRLQELTASDSNAFIEVTHIMPSNANLEQVPASPALTPRSRAGTQPAADYFSIPQTFSKAVTALSYQDALANSAPTSPIPAVAPLSVNLGILERYIPPGSAHEHHDLFETGRHSALINRLSELSTQSITGGGQLIFIYPTRAGAEAFETSHLRPLLDPVLRSIASTYQIPLYFARDVSKFEVSPGVMYTFTELHSKVLALLHKLSTTPTPRTSTKKAKPPPKFELVYAQPTRVTLVRRAWQTWLARQEKARIRAIIEGHLARGSVKSVSGGATATGIFWDIWDRLERRTYAGEYKLSSSSAKAPGQQPHVHHVIDEDEDEEEEEEREPVEVGVFVIKRVA